MTGQKNGNLLAHYLNQLGWSAERLAREVNRVQGDGSISEKAPYGWLKGAKPRGMLPAVVAHILSENLAEPISMRDLWPDKQSNTIPSSEVEHHENRSGSDGEQLTTELRDFNTFAPTRFLDDKHNLYITPELLQGDKGFPRGSILSADRRLAVLDILEALSDKHFPEGILCHIDSVEKFLEEICRVNLIQLLKCQKGSRTTLILGNTVCIDDLTILIKMQPDIEQGRTLRIVLQDPEVPQLDAGSYYVHQIIAISNSIGYYDAIHFSVPQRLNSEIIESIRICVEDIFCAGYFWLQENYRRTLISMGTQFEHECLELFRRQLFAYNYDNFKDHIWLVTIMNGRVFYALDEHVIDLTIDKTKKHNIMQRSSITLASALLANSISFDRSFSEISLRENRVATTDLNNAPYAEVAPDFLAGQYAIHTPSNCLAPLMAYRNASLLTVYPPELHTEFSAVLENPDSNLNTYVRSTSVPIQPAEVRVSGNVAISSNNTQRDIP